MTLTPQQIARARTASSWDKMLKIQKGNSISKPEVSKKPSLKEMNFKEKFGVSYNSWKYWENKLEAKEISKEDIPDKYKKALRHYLINKLRR